MMGKIHIILLAAGQSRRFGGNKLLHCLNGKELYKYLPDAIQSLPAGQSGEKCIVSQYPEIINEMNVRNYQCVMNEMPEKGISHSIFLGISRLEEIHAVSKEDAVMFCVCDQPYLTTETLQGFLEAYKKSGKGIGCVRCREKSGNPVIFGAGYLEELKELQGDRGGKQVLKKHPEDVMYYEVEDASELRDIDTREALEEEFECGNAQMSEKQTADILTESDSLLQLTGLSSKTRAVVAIVGAGGKTTIAYRLADELLASGKRAIVTTTTHMMEPKQCFIEWNEEITVEDNLNRIRKLPKEQIYTVGVRVENSKIKGIPEENLRQLAEIADFLIVEADGSKRMPFKVPAAHEPVIPAETDYIIGVMGFPAVGKRIEEAAHRPEDMASFLGKSVQEYVECEDILKVMTSPDGLLKGVAVPHTLILNRCPRAMTEAEKSIFTENQIVLYEEMETISQETE